MNDSLENTEEKPGLQAQDQLQDQLHEVDQNQAISQAGAVKVRQNECVDLVCSQYVLAEKHQADRTSLEERIARVIGAAAKSIALTALVIVGLAITLAAATQAMSAYGSECDTWFISPVKLFFVELFLLFFYAVYRYGQKPFPTNIIVAPAGIRFAWRLKDDSESDLIPWDAINKIRAYPRSFYMRKPSDQDFVIDLELNNALLGPQQSLRIWKQTKAMGRGIHAPSNWGKLQIKFPLDSLNLDADKFRLVSAIREMAPKAVLASDFDEIFASENTPTYTELWLDDMQTFRRQSLNELPSESAVNDGRYQIIDKVATGGQAKIYKALDTMTNTQVALKELVLPVNAGADVRNRSFANVKKEALLLAQLDHPGILKLLDNFVEDHRAYLVFEYLDGRTLRHIVQQDGPLDESLVVPAAIAICNILAYLHSQSPPVVHRDIAPDNLMITGEGKIVLLDFNFAQQLESNSTRTVVGKHNYMAPEQFKGKPRPQSDLYSLGGTMYFLLTGNDPTPISCNRPGALRQVNPALDNIVAKLTTPDLASRYQLASEAAADLAAVKQEAARPLSDN